MSDDTDVDSLRRELQNLVAELENKVRSNRETLDHIARLIDLAWILKDSHAISKAQEFSLKLKFEDRDQAELFYLLANSWAALRDSINPNSRKDLSWEIAEVEKELIYLRKAAYHSSFDSLPEIRRCQILTNLAGRLSEIGRPSEAVFYWDLVIKNTPSFGMAHGGRGIGLWKYAHHLYNESYRAFFILEAERSLKASCISMNTEPDAKVYYENELKRIPKVKFKEDLKLEPDYGSTKEEIRYREWCQNQRLFLHPLNDLGNHPMALKDILALPSITTSSPEMPLFFNRFNLLKQEFSTSRHLLFLSQDSDKVHYADKGVSLVNILDYQVYSIKCEYMKLAFRSAYSILDKVAFFINDYFNLKLAEKNVYFRSVWYKNGKKELGLSDVFSTSKNWPLRGLFWLSKDIFEKEYQNIISPDAKQLSEIRNHLEHKYLTLHDFFRNGELPENKDGIFSLKVSDFHKKTLHVLNQSRVALIYLSMAIDVEEEIRRSGKEGNGFSMPMQLTDIDDKWKTF